MDARPAHPPRALEPRPELVPRDDIGTADLERLIGRLGPVDRGREIGGYVLDPDRLQLLPAGPDDGRHRRQPSEARELLEGPTVGAKHEARPEDHVVEPRVTDRELH